jgi:hypothetical protein
MFHLVTEKIRQTSLFQCLDIVEAEVGGIHVHSDSDLKDFSGRVFMLLDYILKANDCYEVGAMSQLPAEGYNVLIEFNEKKYIVNRVPITEKLVVGEAAKYLRKNGIKYNERGGGIIHLYSNIPVGNFSLKIATFMSKIIMRDQGYEVGCFSELPGEGFNVVIVFRKNY